MGSNKSYIEKMNSSKFVLLLFGISIFSIFLLPRLLSYGMFFDGVTYSSISRNLATGYGSFWKPYYTSIIYPEFFEQPPLAFLLQSYFFKIFGEVFYVEAIYGALLGFITLLLIIVINRQIKRIDDHCPNSWLSILLFTLFPMTSWIYANNMLENTMTIFILISSIFSIYSISSSSLKKTIIFSLIAGLSLVCSLLSKGPNGIYPFIIPLIWFVVYRNLSLKKLIYIYVVLFISIVIPLLIVFLLNQDAQNFLYNYFSNQVIASIVGKRETASSQYAILKKLFFESLVPIVFLLVLSAITKSFIKIKRNKSFIFLILIAFSGSLPLILSAKQMGWYLFPSYPFYAMALAALFANTSYKIENYFTKNLTTKRIISIVGLFVFIISISWMLLEYKKVRKEKDFHNDLVVYPLQIPPRTIISCYPSELYHNWALVANMQRYYKISISDSVGNKYLITTLDYERSKIIQENYKKIHPLKPTKYVIMMKK